MEENKPPLVPSKLKQVTLNFFKSTPVSVKNNVSGQGLKRKNSSSNCLESPMKSKTGKPFSPITADNTDCKNSKAHKIRKLSYEKISDGNDYEVSSSSEAEAGIAKSGNGNFMDRFVRKLPLDGQQEISSTNEMFEILHPDEPVEIDLNVSTKVDKLSSLGTSGVESLPDCIIIEDSRDAFEKIDDNQALCKVENSSPPKSECRLPKNCDDIEIPEKPSLSLKNIDSIFNEKSDLTKDSENIINDAKCHLDNKDNSFLSEEPLHDSVVNISTLSIECSTPLKAESSSESAIESTPGLSSAPNISVKSNGKKERKTNSHSKAKKETIKIQREVERLERKRKLEFEKAEKRRIKKEKKEIKEKLRIEQKEKLEAEKQEKEKAKEEERFKREEEKKKKQAVIEAKQEEKRKKEEEKKQKEEDKLKEEEEKKKKELKTKEAFQSFFIKPKDTTAKTTQNQKPNTGMFIPFELKKDMYLAPAVRRVALSEDKDNLDQNLANLEMSVKTYLNQLRDGDITPHRTGRVLRINPQPVEGVKIIHDSEALKKAIHCVKLLQFHTDYRPPYYGTWRKKPALSARNPWKKDGSVFDYEIDSDDEWEEEEPGESLSCSDGEEEKGEEAEDDDDDGWMVPHGYLSEDEGCNEDDEITPEKLKLQQLAKAKAWEDEQKRKLQAASAISVACFFENSPSGQMKGDVRLLYEFMAVVLAPIPVHTSLSSCLESDKLEETTSEGASTTPTQKRCQKKTVPDEAMPDLIRLLHGNTGGIKRLIREFRVFWLRKSNATAVNGDNTPNETCQLDESFVENNISSSNLNESINDSINMADSDEPTGDMSKSLNDSKIKEEGYGCGISKRQLEKKITSMAIREKRPGFNKICWYVHDNILAQFNMSDIKLPNSWVHILPLPVRTPVLNTTKTPETPSAVASDVSKSLKTKKKVGTKVIKKIVPQCIFSNEDPTELTLEPKDNENIEIKEASSAKKTSKDQRSIKDFALSKHELQKLPTKVIIEASPKTNVSIQITPKRTNKYLKNQKCIKDFAKSSIIKAAACSTMPEETKIIPCSGQIEVIYVDSSLDSIIGDCSVVNASPVISDVYKCSSVDSQTAEPNFRIKNMEMLPSAETPVENSMVVVDNNHPL